MADVASPAQPARLKVFGAIALAWAVMVAILLIRDMPGTATALGDTDDAMRLVELRAFMAGQGWFDLHEARAFPPLGYDTHWSRLIDLGLAGLLTLLSQVLSPAAAERAMRIVWPLLWLAPTVAAIAAIAWRIAGREAAIVAALLVTNGITAAQQFVPGRIDHHNVQIALAALVAAMAVWNDRARWAAPAAGALTGLALAVGLEGLPVLAAAGGAIALVAVADRALAPRLAAYGLALAGVTTVAFVGLVPASRWGVAVCDALAVNSASGVVFGGLALALAGAAFRTAPFAHPLARLATILGVGGLTAAVALAWDPRCAHGPFAAMDPAVHVLWLATVTEAASLPKVLIDRPNVGFAIAAFPALVAAAALTLVVRRPSWRRDPAILIAIAIFAMSCAATVSAVKVVAYAIWLAMPLAAAAIVALCGAVWSRRIVVALLLAPASVAALALTLVEVVHATPDPLTPERRACLQDASFARMAALPPGVVAAHVDYGPFVLALTPHSIISAPYHRMDVGIRIVYEAFAEPPEAARAKLMAAGVTYLAHCPAPPPPGLSGEAKTASLWGRLDAGEVPAGFEPVIDVAGEAYRVFRLAPKTE